MRNRRLFGTALAASLATVTALATTAGSALAQPTALAAGQAPALAGPPPPGGGFVHTVYSRITITGNSPGAGGSAGVPYTGPPCWLEPRFTGGNSWQPGDPVALTDSGDADEYWWWFAAQQPAFSPVPTHDPGAEHAINMSFKRKQGSGGWWWVPSWEDGTGGMSCALGLVYSLGLNNGFLDFTAPGTPEHGATPGTIDGEILADLARAALRLPAITIHTNPAAGTPSTVNLPVWAWITYHGPRSPFSRASVPLPDGTTLSATVTTSAPSVSLSVDTASARIYNHCGAVGNRYQGGSGAPACGITFLAPSTNGDYTITATATWTVRWTDSQGGGGVFTTPAAVSTTTEQVSVREIQAINGG